MHFHSFFHLQTMNETTATNHATQNVLHSIRQTKHEIYVIDILSSRFGIVLALRTDRQPHFQTKLSIARKTYIYGF